MLKLIKEHSWWISIVLTIILSLFTKESKMCLMKIVLFMKEPSHIIIVLLVIVIIKLYKKS